jgi:hypothetical protein
MGYLNKLVERKHTLEICVDFDGTCVSHEYPKVGADAPNAVEVLKKLAAKGHKLILFTMRDGLSLGDAVKWFKTNNIPLYGVQSNPTQTSWTSSPKAYGQVYIDDAALGCPVLPDTTTGRPIVNWFKVEQMLEEADIL